MNPNSFNKAVIRRVVHGFYEDTKFVTDFDEASKRNSSELLVDASHDHFVVSEILRTLEEIQVITLISHVCYTRQTIDI